MRELKVFLVSAKEPARPPLPGPTLQVQGLTHAEVRAAAREAIEELALGRVRVISFSGSGLVAYVEVRGDE